MPNLPKRFASVLMGTAFAASMVLAGCSARVSSGYRYHDTYYGDDHLWDQGEVTYYGRWEGDTHRAHRDFRRRPSNEQKEYWEWRHNHH